MKDYVFPVGSSSVKDGYSIKASIGGGEPIRFLVDTGSTGFVISRKHLADSKSKVFLTDRPFALTYTSSDNHYGGFWAIASVTFTPDLSNTSRETAVSATTVPMMIRVADFASTGQDVAMMGIGFDRDTSTFEGINPFLMLKEMVDGSMTPGYILTPKSIILGITDDNSKGFTFKKLSRNVNDTSDWSAPKVQVSASTDNARHAFEALLLMDTGLGYSIVQAPKEAHFPSRLPDGVSIRIHLDGKPFYEYVVGDPDAPSYVSWRHSLHAGVPFINTSRFALTEVDYLYDAGGGRLGFCPRTPAKC